MSEIKQPILIVSRNLPPIVGGIERLMHRLISGFALERHCTVVGPRGCKAQLPASVRVVELPHRPAIVFVLLAWVVVNFLCLRERFAAIVAGNGLMRLTAATLMRRCPVVTMVYGLDIIAPHWLYQRLCLPLIADSAAVIACSSNSARMARERGVPADRLHVITPGVEMPVHHDLRSTAESEPEGPLLISVGRLVRRKGVAEFVRYALPLVLERHPDTRLCVIGEDASVALRQDGPESERIRAAAREGGVEANVTLVGFLDENALADMLDRARVHVFPVLDMPDDVEGFGLVALEAAAHGVPTVAFDAGGVSDAVADGVSGALVLSGDYASFADRVCAAIETGRALEESCRAHAEMNSWPRFVRRLTEVMEVTCGSRAQGKRVS